MGVRWPPVTAHTMVVLPYFAVTAPEYQSVQKFESCRFKASALLPGPRFEAVPHFAGCRELELPSRETGHTRGFLLHLESKGCSTFPSVLLLFVLCLCFPHLFSFICSSRSKKCGEDSGAEVGWQEGCSMRRNTALPSGAWGSAWPMPALLFSLALQFSCAVAPSAAKLRIF